MSEEVYTHRTTDNFNYDSDRHPSSIAYQKSFEQIPEMYYVQLNDDQQKRSRERTKPSLSPILETSNSSQIRPEFYYLQIEGNESTNSNYHALPALISEKRKSPKLYQPLREEPPEMDNHQQPKLNDTIVHPHQHQITTYMITASTEDNYLSDIQRIPSPPIRSPKKKPPTIDNHDKYDVSTKQRHSPIALHHTPTNIPYVPLSKSKATESIQRSMNKYRFGGD